MSNRPYRHAKEEWLLEHVQIFQRILHASGQQKDTLEKLRAVSDASPQSVLAFAELRADEVQTALAVCDKIMKALGPTVQAMREELEQRDQQASAPPRSSRLPIVH